MHKIEAKARFLNLNVRLGNKQEQVCADGASCIKFIEFIS